MAAELSELKVLVADDEPKLRALVTKCVQSLGCEVVEAGDGDEAWDIAERENLDVVVLDVMMPGMSGWEVCRRIKSSATTSRGGRPKVLMLTGIGEHLNEMTSPLFAADDWVNKPFDLEVLKGKVTALGRAALADGAARTGPSIRKARPSEPVEGATVEPVTVEPLSDDETVVAVDVKGQSPADAAAVTLDVSKTPVRGGQRARKPPGRKARTTKKKAAKAKVEATKQASKKGPAKTKKKAAKAKAKATKKAAKKKPAKAQAKATKKKPAKAKAKTKATKKPAKAKATKKPRPKARKKAAKKKPARAKATKKPPKATKKTAKKKPAKAKARATKKKATKKANSAVRKTKTEARRATKKAKAKVSRATKQTNAKAKQTVKKVRGASRRAAKTAAQRGGPNTGGMRRRAKKAAGKK